MEESEKSHRILFRDDMVRAILDGRKRVTRRIVNGMTARVDDRPTSQRSWAACRFRWDSAEVKGTPDGQFLNVEGGAPGADPALHMIYPRFEVGDLLRVGEMWGRLPDGKVVYRADLPHPKPAPAWKPGIHLRRADVRITLRVTSVRPEPLSAIDEADAQLEGFAHRSAFLNAWEEINGERTASIDPWVWRIAFELDGGAS